MELDEKATRMLEDLKIPLHMRGTIKRYVESGINPGQFLSAVIRNDLYQAINYADEPNARLLKEYIVWFANYAPPQCWGHDGAIEAWKVYLEQQDD